MIACPTCKHLQTRVLNKRERSRDNTTRRRRVCLGCGRRFNTRESVGAQFIAPSEGVMNHAPTTNDQTEESKNAG